MPTVYTVQEMFKSRSGDAYSDRQREYLVSAFDSGTGQPAELTEQFATLEAANASPISLPGTDGALLRVNSRILRVIDDSRMVVAVEYGEVTGPSLAIAPTNTVEYEFNYQAPSIQIKQSLQTMSITAAPSIVITPTSTRFGGAIGVTREDGKYHVEGVSTAPGNTTNVYTVTLASVNPAYEGVVENLMGCVNSVPYKGRPIGSMRFVSCSSQKAFGQSKTVIRFGFQYERNVSTLVVGDITVPATGGVAKHGHDYLWIYRELNAEANELLPKPKYVVIDRIFRYADLVGLGF